MKNNWVLKNLPNKNHIEDLEKKINVSKPISTLLIQRNISNYQKAKSFFRPRIDDLHDPFLMKGMDNAVERIIEALKNNEQILVYGDYDVDGTTSVAMFYHFLSRISQNCRYYIPDRYEEGYGISKKGIDFAHKKNITLIITLDCGTNDIDFINYAKTLSIDFIICDHHISKSVLPNAYAILNPKQEDCKYPFKELSGCGIGFKLIQALVDHLDTDINPFDYLDFVAISISSDIVSLIGENRVLTYYGIEKIKEKKREGIKQLIYYSEMNEITVSDIVFKIAPKINAAGRIAHASSAVKLLLSSTKDEAKKIVKQLITYNNQRKEFDHKITKQALKQISENTQSNLNANVLYDDSWHKGILGIVASRCIEHDYKPTIILTKSNEYATGSGRSINGFDLYSAISECSNLLENFGGHRYAAGLTMRLNKLNEFKEKFENVVSSTLSKELLTSYVNIDLELNFSDITKNFCDILEQMSPFGPDNLTPLFLSKNIQIASSVNILKDKHLKFKVKQINCEKIFNCIGFNLVNEVDNLQNSKNFSIVYSIMKNEFRGNTTTQFQIKDINFE